MDYARQTMRHTRLRVDPDPVEPVVPTVGSVKVYNPLVVRLPIRQSTGTAAATSHAIVRQKHQRVRLDADAASRTVGINLQIPLDWTGILTGRSLL